LDAVIFNIGDTGTATLSHTTSTHTTPSIHIPHTTHTSSLSDEEENASGEKNEEEQHSTSTHVGFLRSKPTKGPSSHSGFLGTKSTKNLNSPSTHSVPGATTTRSRASPHTGSPVKYMPIHHEEELMQNGGVHDDEVPEEHMHVPVHELAAHEEKEEHSED